VIAAQIAALRSADVAGAFSYASPGIRALFRTPERFGAMVDKGFAVLRQPGDVIWLGQRAEGGQPVQRVMLRSTGAVRILDYRMIEGPDGWRIDGVSPVASGANGA